MEITQLKQFKAIAELGSITKAAEKLYVSQPSLSKMLAKLEEELGVQLFDRVKNRIILNENGKIALNHVDKILGELDLLTNAFMDLSGADGQKTITIGSASPSVTWYFSSRFRHLLPNFAVQTVSIDQINLSRALESGKIDLALSMELLQDANISNMLLYELHFFITVHKDHPFASRERISLQDLNGEMMLNMTGVTYLSKVTSQILANNNVHMRIRRANDTYEFFDILKTDPRFLTFSNILEIKSNNEIYADRKILRTKEILPKQPVYMSYSNNSHKIQNVKRLLRENYAEIMLQ